MAAIDSQMIVPIKFQILKTEDGENYISEEIKKSAAKQQNLPSISTTLNKFGKKQQDAAALSNFFMRPSYPAVTFDRICFSVSKSQQQANFLAECIRRTKQCLLFGLANNSTEEKVNILKEINLTVPTGCIFGLLGPSSCGKTTLLRCLVGLLKPNSGSINLFSQETRTFGSENEEAKVCGSLFCCCSGSGNNGKTTEKHSENVSKVPGTNVGYMPQDLGLYEDFTIRQLLTMFGQYVGMDTCLIKSRISFMTEFLDLPNADRVIMSLSGGQKRRVSFAIACLHMPPLIILDEPTVGVDPLLRRSIWKYLRRLANEENKTIIITTHYIEEAAQADQVALMRAGEILIQDSPKRIMLSNGCKTLEEAFLKICNNSNSRGDYNQTNLHARKQSLMRLMPQSKFDWHDKIKCELNEVMEKSRQVAAAANDREEEKVNHTESREIEAVAIAAAAVEDTTTTTTTVTDSIVRRLQEKAQEKLAIFEYLQTRHAAQSEDAIDNRGSNFKTVIAELERQRASSPSPINLEPSDQRIDGGSSKIEKLTSIRCLKRGKLVITNETKSNGSSISISISNRDESIYPPATSRTNINSLFKDQRKNNDDEDSDRPKKLQPKSFRERMREDCRLMWALLYKNYRRNVNSLPLLAFQFMLPIIQMISFSLCIGGKPTQIGLGLVNNDQFQPPLVNYEPAATELPHLNLPTIFDNSSSSNSTNPDDQLFTSELLSTRYLSFLDNSMLNVRSYENLGDALRDVRRGKLWAAMEIGANFTQSISSRFDLENFYQLDVETIRQSVIKLYPDRSNKVLDMICHRSLVNSYRQFLLDEFEHFKRLPVEVKEPIFDIKPNLISNSMDGYTESIAAGLLASLTYIMAAGLTTFIMVVERSAGILERTYTSGISPTAYLLAHAIFRSLVMMLQIGLVLFLTFYLLQQPLVGSIWLAYLMLMTLNLTGIAYGLLISSLVSDQNGAALTIVSSLVVKITMSGILWPFEAIPRWLRAICYVQPLTMPVQALKSITLKGNGIDDKTVYLGFVVSLTWLVIFLTISARRFKFYQH